MCRSTSCTITTPHECEDQGGYAVVTLLDDEPAHQSGHSAIVSGPSQPSRPHIPTAAPKPSQQPTPISTTGPVVSSSSSPSSSPPSSPQSDSGATRAPKRRREDEEPPSPRPGYRRQRSRASSPNDSPGRPQNMAPHSHESSPGPQTPPSSSASSGSDVSSTPRIVVTTQMRPGGQVTEVRNPSREQLMTAYLRDAFGIIDKHVVLKSGQYVLEDIPGLHRSRVRRSRSRFLPPSE